MKQESVMLRSDPNFVELWQKTQVKKIKRAQLELDRQLDLSAMLRAQIVSLEEELDTAIQMHRECEERIMWLQQVISGEDSTC